MASTLNQYEEKQLAFLIDGYFGITPGDPQRNDPRKAFEYAKKELLAAQARRLELLERFTFERWHKLTECPSGKG